MKKFYYILIVTLILSSCFNNSDDVAKIEENLDNEIKVESNLNDEIDTKIDLDNEIIEEERKLQELEEINEDEINELINSIID